MSDIAQHGPFTVSLEFHLTDGETVAKAGVDMPPGELPTAERIADMAQRVFDQVNDQMGGTFRWVTRQEFVQDLLAEHTGLPSAVRFSVPGADTFEAEWAG